ncbi:ImuA family protein [Rhizobium sp. TH2]|uniref:ImuA family protein n=1 Tax=Rhizobium sp. TH2 TaxID=2775403 RepID=UPI002157B67B|nr:hypothetical protein [Rhizobium sp. TH2]
MMQHQRQSDFASRVLLSPMFAQLGLDGSLGLIELVDALLNALSPMAKGRGPISGQYSRLGRLVLRTESSVPVRSWPSKWRRSNAKSTDSVDERLPPGRVIYVEAGDERALPACMEEGLRSGAVVGEVARLPMAISRRLQLAAESSGTTGIVIRRWRRGPEASDFGQPTASVTRWLLELIRCRAGESADFEVEAPDAKGRIALPADMAY